MKKNVLLIILGVITVGCIIYGSAKHLRGFKSIFRDGGIHISFDDYDESEKDSSSGKFEIDEKLEKFSSIRINAAVMGLTIEEGTGFNIDAFYTKDYLKPEINIKNGGLEIVQHGKKNGFNNGNQNCRVVITVPGGTDLNDVDIDTNVGDVKIRELNIGKIDINLNVGEIDVNNVDFDSLDCDTNVGEISINPVSKLDDYDISASTDVGSVRVEGRSYKRSYNSRGNGKKRIKADTNVGEIKIK